MLFRIKTSVSIIALVLFSATTFNALAYAQASAPEKQNAYIWINAGLGIATQGFAAGATISIQRRQLLVSPRIINMSDILGPSYGDIGLMIGSITREPGSSGYTSISAGIGYVYGYDRFVIGLPIELQVFVTPLSFGGIGLQVFANINTQESYGGLLLCLQLGKLR